MNKVSKSVYIIFFTSFFLFMQANASENVSSKKDIIIEHISDSYEWHIATINRHHLSIPLPIIIYKIGSGIDIFLSNRFYNEEHKKVPYKGYFIAKNDKIKSLDGNQILDISLTKNIISSIISLVLMLFIFITAANRYKKNPYKEPKGFWMFIEMIIYFVRDEIAIPNIGKKYYKKFLPFLLTVFFFIWINNLMGLLPGSANVTGNISVTLVLAIFTFVITNINGKKEYWRHIFALPGIPKWLLPIMIPIEIIGLFTKPFSLMIRLFANITAGHIILLSIINLIFIFKTSLVGLISVPFGAFMIILKLLVAFLQAYVFTLLSSLYFGNAIEEH